MKGTRRCIDQKKKKKRKKERKKKKKEKKKEKSQAKDGINPEKNKSKIHLAKK